MFLLNNKYIIATGLQRTSIYQFESLNPWTSHHNLLVIGLLPDSEGGGTLNTFNLSGEFIYQWLNLLVDFINLLFIRAIRMVQLMHSKLHTASHSPQWRSHTHRPKPSKSTSQESDLYTQMLFRMDWEPWFVTNISFPFWEVINQFPIIINTTCIDITILAWGMCSIILIW